MTSAARGVCRGSSHTGLTAPETRSRLSPHQGLPQRQKVLAGPRRLTTPRSGLAGSPAPVGTGRFQAGSRHPQTLCGIRTCSPTVPDLEGVQPVGSQLRWAGSACAAWLCLCHALWDGDRPPGCPDAPACMSQLGEPEAESGGPGRVRGTRRSRPRGTCASSAGCHAHQAHVTGQTPPAFAASAAWEMRLGLPPRRGQRAARPELDPSHTEPPASSAHFARVT